MLYELLFIQSLIDKGRDDAQLRKALGEARDPLGTRNQVQEQDLILRNTSGFEHVDGQRRRAT